MAEVRISGVRKSFGDVAVLHGIDTTIADGEFMVLLGPSGCGKSTLLRIVAGLEQQSAGDVSIGGRVVNDVEPKDRNIAMVFQNYALYPHLSVYDNMAYGLRVRGTPRPEIERRVQEAARILELGQLLQRKPRQLSGGQRQRVAMGRAIVRDPQVFLFDEPLSNLDAKLRVQMRIEIKALHQRLKTTTIYVTHDQIEAMTMADRIVVMHDGIVEQVGTPLELYDHPSNLFVAGFIGSPAMNFIEGTLRRDGGAPVLEAKGGSLALPASTPGADGQKVTLGIRPEHLSISATGPASLDAVVEVVEPTGADTHVVAIAFGQQVQAVFTERHAFAPGARVALCPRAEAIHLFDTASGRHL